MMKKCITVAIWIIVLVVLYLVAFWADQRISQNFAIVTTMLTTVFGFMFGLMIAQYKVKQEAFLEALMQMSKALYEPGAADHHEFNRAFYSILLFANRKTVMAATDFVSDAKHTERGKNLTTELQKVISLMRDELSPSPFSVFHRIKAKEFRQIYTVFIKKSTSKKPFAKSQGPEPTYNFTNCSDIIIHKPLQ